MEPVPYFVFMIIRTVIFVNMYISLPIKIVEMYKLRYEILCISTTGTSMF